MPRPLVIAHRGASADVAEHTLGAFRVAIAQGADGLECDVRLTADEQLVCLHDRTLERTGGGSGIVSAMTLQELRAVDWGAWKHGSPGARDGSPRPDRDPDSGRLVTLRELVELALAAGRPLTLAVETKHPTRAGGRVEKEVARVLTDYELDGVSGRDGVAGPHSPAQVSVRVMSFSALAVRRMAGLMPGLPVVYLMTPPVPLPYRGAGLPTGATTAGVDVAILRERPEVVAAHHDAGHEVYVWTVDDDSDVETCLNAGVDAIITNRPDHVLDLVGRNG